MGGGDKETPVTGPKRPRVKYTDEFRATAVVALRMAGWPEQVGALSRVAADLGLHWITLGRWAKGESNPPPNILVQTKQVELADLFEQEMRSIFQAMETKRGEASYRDLGVVLGITSDKRQLLNDQPTANVKETIHYVREGIATLHEQDASRAASDIRGVPAFQRGGVRTQVGQDDPGNGRVH